MATTSPYNKVVLAGGTGSLGSVVLSGLINAGFSITLLTREGSNSKPSIPSGADVTIKPVDYASASSLKAAIDGAEALVITVSTTAIQQQFTLVDAAIEAGVKRIIPSEFGCDTLNAHTCKLPVFGAKVAVAEHLAEKAKQNPGFSYTLLMNNAFYDWPPALGGFIVNIPGRKADLFDGGDRPFSTTRLASVAQGIVGILKHPSETANKAMYIHDAVVTQNQLIEIAEKAGSGKFETKNVDLAELEEESYAGLKEPDANMTVLMVNFLKCAIFRKGRGGDFSDKVDNELLGVKMQTKEELETTITRLV